MESGWYSPHHPHTALQGYIESWLQSPGSGEDKGLSQPVGQLVITL